MNEKFKDIEEDFFEAYRSRLNDFMFLKNSKDNHKMLIMHLGGVIIECYLKHLIVRKYNIKKYIFAKNSMYWCSEETANQLNHNNLRNEDIKNCSELLNPGHDLEEAIKALPELNNIINEDISIKLRHIQDPLNQNKPTYIDLRYRKNDFFDEAEKIDRWISDFIDIQIWIQSNYSGDEG